MSITLSALQKQRRDSAANWTAENPTLLAGEIGIESDTGYWKVGDGSTAWTSLAYISGLGAEIPVSRLADGSARQLLQTAANGTDVEWTSNVDIPGTLDVTGAATFDAAVTIQGDLTVNGTTTTIDTQNLIVEDKNVIIGQVTTPTDVTADGGGITLKGTTDKTINWIDATDAWTSSERFSVPTGTAAAPSLTFTGDPNTGVYSPGADQVAISTNGTGRLFVGSDGKVTVNHQSFASPIDSPLAVAFGAGASIGCFRFSDNTAGPSLRLSKSRSGTVGTNTLVSNGDTLGNIEFYGADGSTYYVGASIRSSADTPSLGAMPGTLIFSTTPSASTSPTERLRITSAGLVGVGTSSPSARLHVETTGSDCEVLLNRTDAATAGSLSIGSANNSNYVYGSGAKPLLFFTNASERIRIDSSGRVGIGTTSPTDTLDVQQSGATCAVKATRSDASIAGGLSIQGGNLQNNLFSAGAKPLVIYTDSTERARIDSSGRLLVGTSSSTDFANLIQVASTSSGAFQGFRYSNDALASNIVLAKSRGSTIGTPGAVLDGDNVGSLAFRASDGTNFVTAANIIAQVDGTPGTNDMPGRLVFSTTADGASSPTERMRITQAGSVLFNTTSNPSSSGTGSGFVPEGDGRATLYMRTNTTGGRVLCNFGNPNGEVGSIQVSGTATSYVTSSDYRLKENVVAISNGIARLQQLKPSRFNFIADPATPVDGFIAHEVQTVVPEAITGEKDAVDDDGNPIYQGIDQSKLVPLLTAALQEAIGEIESLKARVAALESV